MPPRPGKLPDATTESARQARQAFHCDVCNKGYARVVEYDAHLSGYEHTHNVREQDSRKFRTQMQSANRRDDNDGQMKPMSLEPKAAGGVKKKPVFKSANNAKPAVDSEATMTNSTDDSPFTKQAYVATPMPPVKPATQVAIDRYLAGRDGEERIDEWGYSEGMAPPVGVVHPHVISMRASPTYCTGGTFCACIDVDTLWSWKYDWKFLKDILAAEGYGYWVADVEWSQMAKGVTT
ncbi:hypothetical protein MBLNU230_g3344t1 [Neophaeotheca triangularis]